MIRGELTAPLQVKVMRRAKVWTLPLASLLARPHPQLTSTPHQVSVHTADVKAVLRAYSIEVSASSAADLAEDDVVRSLRKAGGANYNRSSFA